MRLSIITIALCIFSVSILATEEKDAPKSDNEITKELSGCVIDELTGEVLAGVAVKVGEHIAYTDFDGLFKFEQVDINITTIETSYIAYEDKTVELTNLPSKEIKISLKEK